MESGRQCHAVLHAATLAFLLVLFAGLPAEGATSGEQNPLHV